MRAKRTKICNFYVKLDIYKSGKKGVIGCGLNKKKGGHRQALDIHQHMGVPPPPPGGYNIIADMSLILNIVV